MKHLIERTEIASTINFRRMPVVEIDVSIKDDYGISGTKVLIDNGHFKDGNPYRVRATLRAYNDERKLRFCSYGTFLSSSFDYNDMVEILEYAKAPIIGADEDILVCIVDKAKRVAYAPVVLRTGAHIDPHCSTPMTLEEYDMTRWLF